MKTVTNIYDLSTLLRTAKYLIQIEDRVAPAFFIDDRAMFKKIIDFHRLLKDWQLQGYTKAALTHYPDIKVNIYQPYFDYYFWVARLNNLVDIKPLR